jgi:hypothetical protein
MIQILYRKRKTYFSKTANNKWVKDYSVDIDQEQNPEQEQEP